jgi:2'-5' RNA ligase
MTTRLFIALEVPAELKRQMESLPRKGLDSAHFQHPGDLHITLRFIGEAEDEQIPEIQKILEGIPVKKFGVVVKGLGIFHKKNQEILYAPVESARMVTHLSAEITERLQKARFVFTPQPYTPHVTLARLKTAHGLDQYVQKNKDKIHAEWTAQNFILFRSADPDEGGKRYTKLREYSLKNY